jgi:hypothetical protein
MNDTTYALLWSQSQNALHIETVAELLKTDADAFKENRRMDYVPMYFGTDDDCHVFARELRPILRDREENRSATERVVDVIVGRAG